MCLDTSLAIYAPATEPTSGHQDDWTRLTHRCVGFFKSFFLYALSTVYIELNAQIDEQKHPFAVFAPLVSSSTPDSARPFALPTNFQTLRNVLVSAHETAIARVRNGETNAKGAVFMSCVLACNGSLVSGADAEQAVLAAAKKAVKDVSQIMGEVYHAEHWVLIDLNISYTGNGAGRGEGADDVTGRGVRTGTEVGSEIEGTPTDPNDGGHGNAGGGKSGASMLDGTIGGFDMLDDGLDAYTDAPSMDSVDYSNHFSRSPEWFYDINGYAAPHNWFNEFSGI